MNTHDELLPTSRLILKKHRIAIEPEIFNKLSEIRKKERLYDREATILFLYKFYEEYDGVVRRLKQRISELESEIKTIKEK